VIGVIDRPADWRDRYRYPTVHFPSWSSSHPDRLVFVSNEGGSTQVWTANIDTGERRPLTEQRVGVEEFVLSPGGDAVAWWSDDSGDGNGAWVATELEGGRTAPLLTGLGEGWSEGLAWCGQRAAVALTDGSAYRLYVGDIGTEARLMHESDRPFGLGREWETTAGGLSTDGALICLRHSDAGDMLHFGLRVLDADSGIVHADLVHDGLNVQVASWSPIAGDQRVALIHERDGIERPAVWQPLGDECRSYPSDLPGEIDVAGWYPDATKLLVTHWHDGRSQLYALDLDSGRYDLIHDPAAYISGAGVRPDGSVWLREETGERAPRIRDVEGGVVLAPTGAAPAGAANRSLRFEGPTGEPTHMMVATPVGAGPFPTVMLVHGGPEWADPDLYDPWTSTLVDHGVAVAKVNYRGSTGFGVAWRTALHDGNIGFPEVSDVVAGLSYLIDLGVADPQRCAIEGWSWGGYIAMLAIGLHPTSFVAAIGGIPVCDAVMTHEDCSPSQQAYDRAIMGGTPTEVPDRYRERSPSTYLDAVRTPVLIIAGEHDTACPIRQVRYFVDELTARGRLVQLHVYDAGHHANSIDEKIIHAEHELEFLAAHGVVPPPSA
jgi:dipeptidyl aminopeptidase/acylaminoacyl peptidase